MKLLPEKNSGCFNQSYFLIVKSMVNIMLTRVFRFYPSFEHPIADFGHRNICIFLCIMQWDEKELDTQFTPKAYFRHPILKSCL